MSGNFFQVDKIEQRLFYYLCGVAFFLPFSKAASNIFLGFSLLAFFHRMFRKHDDAAKNFRECKKIFEPIGALLAAVLISALFSGEIAEGLINFTNKYIFHMSAMLPIIFVRFDREKIFRLFKFLIAGVFISNLVVVIQALPHLDARRWRFGGTLSVMSQGSLLIMFLPVFLILLMYLKRRSLKILVLLGFVNCLLAMIFNGTRGAWVAALVLVPAIIFLYFGFTKKSVAGFLIFVFATGLIFFTVPAFKRRAWSIRSMKMRSNVERFLMWESAFNMFKDHPLTGVGYGQYGKAYQTKYILPKAREKNLVHAHSNVMQMLGECGILGLSAFLFLWLYLSIFALRGWRREKNIACLMFLCMLWGMMLHGLTEFNFEASVPSKILWFSLALCLAYMRSENSKLLPENGGIIS